MPSNLGRLVVDVQTNKSGGSVAYGDVVINDGSNSHAFTTTTTGAFTAGVVGVCIEPNGIASNATGRIQYQGFCAQVNTNASVTNGYFLKTHTVAKQAAGSSTRVVGSFGVVMNTASNPTALLWGFPDATSASGNVAADSIWDAKGDLAAGTAADTAARLAVGADDTILMADSAQTTGLKWVASATPSTQAFGDAAAVGTADTFTRGDHKHGMPAASGLIGLCAYDPGSGVDTTTTTSFVDLDATNVKVVFTAPASGNVLVRVTFQCYPGASSGSLVVAIRESSSTVGNSAQVRGDNATNAVDTVSRTFYFAGISAGSHTYTVAVKHATNAWHVRYGGGDGSTGIISIEVFAAP